MIWRPRRTFPDGGGKLLGGGGQRLRTLAAVGQRVACLRRKRLRRALALLQRGALLLDAAQRLGGSGGLLLGGRRNDLRAALRFARRGFGFQCSRGYRLAAFGEAADFLAQLAERQDHGLALFRFRRRAIGSRLDHRGNRGDLLLDLSGQTLGIARALFRRFGQRADLVGNHGKTAPVIAGARGLDRGIERQEIGLVRDLTDGLGDVADAGGLALNCSMIVTEPVCRIPLCLMLLAQAPIWLEVSVSRPCKRSVRRRAESARSRACTSADVRWRRPTTSPARRWRPLRRRWRSAPWRGATLRQPTTLR